MAKNHCNEGLDNRCRDENGRIRTKRSDTLVETLRGEYGPDFARDFRSDARLGTVRERTGKSLSELVHGNKKNS
jgi:hypothetical protein